MDYVDVQIRAFVLSIYHERSSNLFKKYRENLRPKTGWYSVIISELSAPQEHRGSLSVDEESLATIAFPMND